MTPREQKKKYEQTYGTRPDPISRQGVSLTDKQKESIQSNKDALADAASLTGSAAEADLSTRMNLMEQAIQGYGTMTGQAAKLASDWMAGKFSGDMVSDRAAARGFSLGFNPNDTQFVNFGELRNYGLEVMEMQKQGLAAFNQLTAGAGGLIGNPMSVQNMLTSPDKLFAAAQSESDRDVQIDNYNANLRAMPDAALVARADEERMNRVSAASRGSGFTGFARADDNNPYSYNRYYV